MDHDRIVSIRVHCGGSSARFRAAGRVRRGQISIRANAWAGRRSAAAAEAAELILWQGEPHKPFVFVIQQGTVSLWDETNGNEAQGIAGRVGPWTRFPCGR